MGKAGATSILSVFDRNIPDGPERKITVTSRLCSVIYTAVVNDDISPVHILN
jgi:hypothetical protein